MVRSERAARRRWGRRKPLARRGGTFSSSSTSPRLSRYFGSDAARSATSMSTSGRPASSAGLSCSTVRPPATKWLGASTCVEQPQLKLIACLLRDPGGAVVSGDLRISRDTSWRLGQPAMPSLMPNPQSWHWNGRPGACAWPVAGSETRMRFASPLEVARLARKSDMKPFGSGASALAASLMASSTLAWILCLSR